MRQRKTIKLPVTLDLARKMFHSGDDELKEKALEYFNEIDLITQESLISTFIHEVRGDFALNVKEIDIEKIKELIPIISIEKYKDLIYPLIKEHERSIRFAKTFMEYYDHIDDKIIMNKFKITYE